MLKIHEFVMLLDSKMELSNTKDPKEAFKVLEKLDLDESVLYDYKQYWRSLLKSNLKYEKNTVFINMPQ